MRRSAVVVTAFAGVLGATVAHGQSLSGEYKIGVLEPLTGPLAGEGKRHLEGYEIVRDMINERGGVAGRKLVFTGADAPDPTAAASEANRLITREGGKIITGTFSSRLCGAASEAAARHTVIYWETSCVDPPIITRFKQLNPDVVHHIGYTNDAPLFWRQAREQNFLFKALVHAGATGYGSPDFGRALGNDANGVFALLEPGPGFRLESLKPEGQKLEREFREAVQKRTGSYPLGGHQLAGSGLWLLKVVLDRAKSDDLAKFRDAVMSLDLPVGSMINGWGGKFDEHGQNSRARVQHYMA